MSGTRVGGVGRGDGVAAAALFDERGYDATTTREIGERAGVDAALIARYFGGKEGLYLATLTARDRPALPADPTEALAAMLTRVEQRGIGPVTLAMTSQTLSDAVRDRTGEVLRVRVVEPLAAELAGRGVDAPELRAELLVALATGVSLTRAGGTLPHLAQAPLEDVLAVLAPLVAALGGEGAGSGEDARGRSGAGRGDQR